MGRDDTNQLLTPTDVRRLLDEHSLAPRRADGQNFVIDPNTVRKVVRDAAITSDDHVLEFGAGLGSLTFALADRAASVVAIELDSGFAEVLRDLVTDREDVRIVHADALDLDLGRLLDEEGHERVRLVANLPYNVATHLVFHALECPRITDAFVMVQREVGQRWQARPGDEQYGAVSVKLALLADVEVVADVPRTVFHPTPNVDSVTVRITRRPDALEGDAYRSVAEVVDAAFATRRKTLRNALGRVHDRDRLDDAFAAAGVDPGARAEALSPNAFRELAAALQAVPEGEG